MYDLKQAPEHWIKRSTNISDPEDLNKWLDPNLYIKAKEGESIVMVVYVDDLIITSNSTRLVDEEKGTLLYNFLYDRIRIITLFFRNWSLVAKRQDIYITSKICNKIA